MARVLVLGGGLAGMAAAAALGSSEHDVTVLEARPFPGGRATSYALPGGEEPIDNCQHILLRCCVNLLDFYERLGVRGRISFHRELYFIEPGGRCSVMKRGVLPAPLHFAGAFASLRFLSAGEKIAVARALLALRRERRRTDLDRITMLDWLREQRQPRRAIERFWRQVLVSAINEELEHMAAAHGFQVFWLGFLAARDSYEMGVPNVPLGELYSAEAWRSLPRVDFRFRSPVRAIESDGARITAVLTDEGPLRADHYVSALPADRAAALLPSLGVERDAFAPSPITGIHLWFDRPVTTLPHATLLDRTLQWMFNKADGRYLQLVVSASRSLTPLSRQEVIDLALAELAEFFPAAREARLERAEVIKEIHATFSARPGLEAQRPGAVTRFTNLSLAGDWTRSGWPATMEGAVRSGYIAAGHASRALGAPRVYLLSDIA